MSFADVQRLALLNAARVPAGKELLTYGGFGAQNDTAAEMAKLFGSSQLTQSQQRGVTDYIKDLVGGTLAGVTSFVDFGRKAADYAGAQIGLPGLGSGMFSPFYGNVALGAIPQSRDLGKPTAEKLFNVPKQIAADPTSTTFQVGNIAGQIGTAFLGTGMLSGAARAAEIGQTALGLGAFSTTAADLGAGAAVGSVMQAAGDWDQFDPKSDTPGAKMSGAEYLTRMAMGGLTGAVAAPLNPKWGALANVGFDAFVGAATQGAIEGASYAAATAERQKEIEATAGQNTAMSAATNAFIGAAVRHAPGIFNLITGKPKVTPEAVAAAASPGATTPAAEVAAPGSTTAAPAAVTAAATAPGTSSYSAQEAQLMANIHAWASELPPNNLEAVKASIGAEAATPEAIVAKMQLDINDVDPDKSDFSRAAEWVDGMLNKNWHPKGSGVIIPEPGTQPIAGVAEPVSGVAEPPAPTQPEYTEDMERAALQEAPPAEAPVVPPAQPEQPVGTKAGIAARIEAQKMTPLERAAIAEKMGLRRTDEETIGAALSDPFVLMEHILSKNPEAVGELAQTLNLPEASPKAIIDALAAKIDTAGKSQDEILDQLIDSMMEVGSQKPASEAPPIRGEENVQQGIEGNNVSEPGQRIARGEQPATPEQPSQIQPEAEAPPVSEKGQAQEVAPVEPIITGEPYATQEGQVTEGGQPEYLGVPQGENVQENVGEVRQEEGGRPGDSGGALEGGQEQEPIVREQARTVAQSLVDMEGELSARSEAMSDDVRSFLSGETVARVMSGKENPLRDVLQRISDITETAIPDARTLKRTATKNADGSLINSIRLEKDGVPIADVMYYQEPGRRAQMVVSPSEELSASIRQLREEALAATSQEEFGVEPDIAEIFGQNQAIGQEELFGGEGVAPALSTESPQAKRQKKFQETRQLNAEIQSLYDEEVGRVASDYDVPKEMVGDAIDAYAAAQNTGATGAEVFDTPEWARYLSQLSDEDAVTAESLRFQRDIIAALEIKKQFDQIQDISASVAATDAPKRKSKKGQGTIRFDEGAAKASFGVMPMMLTGGLNDDEEYILGIKGSTLKYMAAAAGGAVFLTHSISKKPIFGIGEKVSGLASERTTWLQLLRNKLPWNKKKAFARADIENKTRAWGAVFGLTEEQIQATLAKNIADHEALESIPRLPGMRGITALKILGEQTASPLPGRLSEAAYEGRAFGFFASIPIRSAQTAFESLPADRQVRLGKLITDIDYQTTKTLNDMGLLTSSNAWTNKATNTTEVLDKVVNNVINTTLVELRKTNPEAADLLDADYKMLDPLYDAARRAYFEMVAYEQTGVKNIAAGFKEYDDIVKTLKEQIDATVADAQKAQAKGLSVDVVRAKASAIAGLHSQYKTATKMRNKLGDFRNAQRMSVERKYIPRWFDVDTHQYRIRIKETAADVGLMQSFESREKMTAFLNQINAPLDAEFRKKQGIPEKHPVTDLPITSLADLYRAQGGIVETVTNKFSLSKLMESSANQMALREALEHLSDATEAGDGIPAERFKQFLDVYGGDLSKMVTGKELDDIGISSRAIDALTNTSSKVSATTLRRLVNAIAVPRMVDTTMHRTNVLGYAPEAVNPITKEVNPLYERQMTDFINNGFNFFLARTKSRAESASLRRELNAQIVDLTSRGIAWNYVETLGRISSGLRWKPVPLTTITGEKIPLMKVDAALAGFGAFKMMGGGVPAAVKNVMMGYVNTATQLPFETGGNLVKAVKAGAVGESAYWSNLAQDKILRKQFSEFLRSPASMQTVEDQIAAVLKGNDAARAVWILAQQSGAFEAQFYQSLERVIKPEIFKDSKLAQKIADISAAPQVMAEHHNRGASFMTGALISLESFPNDIERAFAKGLEFQGMTQGNFNNYNKSLLERKILEVPGGRSFLLLSNAAMRSSEQLGAHFLAAATRPLHMKHWVPIIAFMGTSILLTGLIGSAIVGDLYKGANFFADLYEKDDAELKAVKESRPERWVRQAGQMAQSLGLTRDFGEWAMNNMLQGTASVLTGKNFSTENAVTNFVTQFPPPGFAAPVAFWDFLVKWDAGDMPKEQLLTNLVGQVNTQMGRVTRATIQKIEGGKMGQSGDIVTPSYTWGQWAGDIAFGSDLDEAMYGSSKRVGGGKLYFPDQANQYMKTITSIFGKSHMQDIHLAPFYEKVEGMPEPQARVYAANRFRDLNIVNYDALKPEENRSMQMLNAIIDDPEKRKILVRIAMEGQEGSKLSRQPKEFFDDMRRKLQGFYLANAVQRSYAQLGIPPPEYKYQGGDPMLPVWKYLASKVNRSQLQLAPEE